MNKRTTAQLTRAMDTLEVIYESASEELRIVEDKLTALRAQQDQLYAERNRLAEKRASAWEAIDAIENLVPSTLRPAPETTVPDNDEDYCGSPVPNLTAGLVTGLNWPATTRD